MAQSEIRKTVEGREAVMRDEGSKLVIEVPKPKEMTLEEIDQKSLTLCRGCTGILTAALHVIV